VHALAVVAGMAAVHPFRDRPLCDDVHHAMRGHRPPPKACPAVPAMRVNPPLPLPASALHLLDLLHHALEHQRERELVRSVTADVGCIGDFRITHSEQLSSWT